MTEKKAQKQQEHFTSVSQLVELRRRYEVEQKDYLNFCYQYMNFYTGLILTILGATIAGIVQVKSGEIRNIVLISGPIVATFLGTLGYANVKVFYRRFVEAWLTLRNIEEMLSGEYERITFHVDRQPLFISKAGGFITRFERTKIEQTIKEADSKGLTAEEVVNRITETGDTLYYSRLTFTLFIVISIVLFIAIILSVCGVF
jgi:hypothetical protein